MLQEEMRELAKRRLFSYRDDSAAVAEWESATSELAGKSDNMGIRGSSTSDPTARVAERRIDPPKYIAESMAWVDAINDAWADLQHEDESKGIAGRGKAFVMEKYYGLIERNRAKYAQKINDLSVQCLVSDGTIKTWVRECVVTVALHAASKRLE